MSHRSLSTFLTYANIDLSSWGKKKTAGWWSMRQNKRLNQFQFPLPNVKASFQRSPENDVVSFTHFHIYLTTPAHVELIDLTFFKGEALFSLLPLKKASFHKIHRHFQSTTSTAYYWLISFLSHLRLLWVEHLIPSFLISWFFIYHHTNCIYPRNNYICD